MASLADLFNPSFFIILGIVALFIALVIVYFESKMREQNHKIASMLSLVSTLAEDMNGVKMGLNHLAITTINGGGQRNVEKNTPQNLGTTNVKENSISLIEVSDDESEEEEDEEDQNTENSVSDTDLEDENDEGDDEDDEDNIKVVKLTISDNIEDDETDPYEEANNLEFDPDDDLEGLDEDLLNVIPQISEEYTEEMLNLKYDEINKEQPIILKSELTELSEEPLVKSELKTISINLGEEPSSEHIDYKKLQLPKLRSIVVEKGLTSSSEAQKLKKPELLKLLGVE